MKWYMGAIQGAAQSVRENLAAMRDLEGQKELEQLRIDEEAKQKNKLLSQKYGVGSSGNDIIFNNRDIKSLGLSNKDEKIYTVEDLKNNLKNYTSADINHLYKTDNANWEKLHSRFNEVYRSYFDKVSDVAGNITYMPSDYAYLDDYGEAGAELKSLLDNINPLDKPELKTTVDGTEFYALKTDNINIMEPDSFYIQPNEADLNKMKLDLKPILMHEMYSGYTQDDEFESFTSNTGNVVIAHALLNINKEGNTATMNEQYYDNVAEAMLAYDMSFQDVTKIIDMMLPKYTVNITGDTTGKVVPYEKIGRDEQSKAEAAIDSYPRMFELIKKISDVYEITGKSGAIAAVDKFLVGVFDGPNAQIAQFGALISEFSDKNVFADVTQEGKGEGANRIEGFKRWSGKFNKLYKDLERFHIKGELSEKDARLVAQDVMRYSLAFQLAITEQGSGGKAVSDQDFDRAYARTGVSWFQNPEQGIAKLQELESEFYPKYIKAHISNQYSGTAKRGWDVWEHITIAKKRLNKKLMINLNQYELFSGSDGNTEYATQLFTDPETQQTVPAYGRLKYLRDFIIGKQFNNLDEVKAETFWSEMTPTERMWATPDNIFEKELNKSLDNKSGSEAFNDSSDINSTGTGNNKNNKVTGTAKIDLQHLTASLRGFENGNYISDSVLIDNPYDIPQENTIKWGEKEDNKYRKNRKWITDEKAVRKQLEQEKKTMVNNINHLFGVANIQDAISKYNEYYSNNAVQNLNQEGVNLLIFNLPDLEEALIYGGYAESIQQEETSNTGIKKVKGI
jgi:hypothetical protein|tara:strand:+ start:2013 stop:4391 length:2379 start_codon:yes stop_codon:yes gene_type:complete